MLFNIGQDAPQPPFGETSWGKTLWSAGMGAQPTTEPAYDGRQLIVAELTVRQVNHALRVAHRVGFVRFYRDRQNGIGAGESEPDCRARRCEASNSFVLDGVIPTPFTATHARQ